jgi:hypothetical protein
VATVEQARVEVLFELLDLESHSRLRHEQHFGRLGKRQLLGNRVKYLKPAIRHNPLPNKNYLMPVFNHKSSPMSAIYGSGTLRRSRYPCRIEPLRHRSIKVQAYLS